jgi:hypothetical protein
MNKTFPCGHQGKGQYCHRCKQKEDQKQAAAQERAAWNEKLSAAPIRLDHLPRDVVERVLEVLQGLQQGKWAGGKRLTKMGQRVIISIPIGWKYRLICKEKEGRLECLEVITHETYNQRLASGGWA